MSLAHYFTFIRIFISPIFLVVYLFHKQLGISEVILPFVLLFLHGVSETSDAFDGYIARKYNQVTDFGKIFDPMADSIYRISLFLTFTQKPVSIPMWLVFIFFYRDSVISTIRSICALKGFALAARMSGKIKAVIQGTAALGIILLMIPASVGMITAEQLTYYSTLIVGVAALYTLYSGLDYILANRPYIAKILSA